jgi:site-specific recombinase XerC
VSGLVFLQDEEVRRVMVSFEGPWALRNRAIFAVGTGCGLRIGEILNLRLGEVGDGFKVRPILEVVTLKQGGRPRTRRVPVPGWVEMYATVWYQIVLRWKASELPTYWFPSGWGRAGDVPLTVRAFRSALQVAVRRAGVKGRVSTHSMRKTYAQKVWVASGHNVKMVQELLGHRSMESTGVYIGLDWREVCEVTGRVDFGR